MSNAPPAVVRVRRRPEPHRHAGVVSPLRRRACAGGRRLVLVVAGGLILLAGGALAYYGVTHSGPKPGPTPREDQPPDDRGEPLRVAGKKLTVPVRPAEAAKIDLAVARGVWYLQRTQQDSGSWRAQPGIRATCRWAWRPCPP